MTLDDHLVLEEALEVQPGDDVLCIASSGDAPLNLLRHSPGSVVALDISREQLYLSELKRAALQALDPASIREFVGLGSPTGGRHEQYQVIRVGLSAEARRFWDDHPRIISTGVIFQGAVHRLASPVRAMGSLAKRNRRVAGSRTFLARRTNPYLGPLLLGGCSDVTALPPYLTDDNYLSIRANLGRVRLAHMDLRQFLAEADDNTIDVFALSNVLDWIPVNEFAEVFDQILRVGRPGARVLVFSRSRNLRIAGAAQDSAISNKDYDAALLRRDRVHYFRSCRALTLVKDPVEFRYTSERAS
jgi:S-adenosylmethionine:diacylglycerol 3-amino-3-carboxypropyl transferase